MKYYAVRVGRVIGIYFLWEDCKAQVDKYPKAEYKSFTSIMDAVEYIAFEASDYLTKK
jgi:ribonuclease HI